LSDEFSEIDKKVYSLIFKRTVASQMKAYIYDTITMTIGISNNELKYTLCKATAFISTLVNNRICLGNVV
jgi:DNA topoisomerase IA